LNEEEFENGLIDPKSVEFKNRFEEAINGQRSVKGSLEVIYDAMEYNFKQIRLRLHQNRSAIHKMTLQNSFIEKGLNELQAKQCELTEEFEDHRSNEKIKEIRKETTQKVILKTVGTAAAGITVFLAICQLVTLFGGL